MTQAERIHEINQAEKTLKAIKAASYEIQWLHPEKYDATIKELINNAMDAAMANYKRLANAIARHC